MTASQCVHFRSLIVIRSSICTPSPNSCVQPVCVFLLLSHLKDHFEQSQFEEIARSPAGGKKLKPNAIPTLFCVGDPPYPAVTSPYILLPLKPEPGI